MHTAAGGSQTQLGRGGDTFAQKFSDRKTPSRSSPEIACLRVWLPGRSPREVRRKPLGYCSNIVEVSIKRRRKGEVTTSELNSRIRQH